MTGMIIGYYPGHLKNDPSLPTLTAHHLSHIGYWAKNPNRNKCRYYLTKALILPWPEDFISESWNPEERDKVATYLDSAPFPPNTEWWRGDSRCRLCGKLLGYRDHIDGTYTWPEGFSHYLREHNVRPPKEFVGHVLRQLEL